MTVPAPVTAPQDWLLAMLSADPADYRMVTIRGFNAMYGERITCHLHAVTVVWQTLHRHLAETEQAWRAEHQDEDGPHAQLHRPGDLEAEGPEVRPQQWSWSTCRSCGARIVWALTGSGKRMPVNAAPSPAGNVLLVPDARPGRPPLALVLYTEQARDDVPRDRRHMPHFATCPQADKHRRPR